MDVYPFDALSTGVGYVMTGKYDYMRITAEEAEFFFKNTLP